MEKRPSEFRSRFKPCVYVYNVVNSVTQCLSQHCNNDDNELNAVRVLQSVTVNGVCPVKNNSSVQCDCLG